MMDIYPPVKKFQRRLWPFWHYTEMSRTDGRTDRQSDLLHQIAR